VRNYDEFKKLNVELLQISADTVPSLMVWAEQFGGVPFPLLSDYWPHGAVGKAYGVFNEERGMDRRSAFSSMRKASSATPGCTSRAPSPKAGICSSGCARSEQQRPLPEFMRMQGALLFPVSFSCLRPVLHQHHAAAFPRESARHVHTREMTVSRSSQSRCWCWGAATGWAADKTPRATPR